MSILARADHRTWWRHALRQGAVDTLLALVGGTPPPANPYSRGCRRGRNWQRGAALANKLADQLEAIAP